MPSLQKDPVLSFSLDFCKSHHQINSLISTAQGAGQQLLTPAANAISWSQAWKTGKITFQGYCCLCHLSALFTLTEAKPRTRPTSGITHLRHQHCPDAPAHKHQWLPGCPGLSAPAFLTFLTVTTRPLMLLSVHTTSLDTRDPSWVTSQPGRLAELLEGQR